MRFSVLALLCLPSLFAQGPDTTAARGRELFQQSCAGCHGPDATGAEGPNLILSSLVRHDHDGQSIMEVIREGRPAKGMPAFPFDPDQLSQLVGFLRARIQESDRRSAGEPGANFSLQKLNTGDAKAGQKFFDEHCTGCHSPTKDLRGIASKYEPVVLQRTFLYPRDVPQTAIVTTRQGETLRGELVYTDPFTIGIRNSSGWYQSWFRQDVRVRIVDPLAKHRELLATYTESTLHDVFAYLETLR